MRLLIVAASWLVGAYSGFLLFGHAAATKAYHLSDIQGVACRVSVEDVPTEVFLPYRRGSIALCVGATYHVMTLEEYLFDFLPRDRDKDVDKVILQ